MPSNAPLVAHSLTEARLYLMVTPCPSCDKGPLRFTQARPIREGGAHRAVAHDEGSGLIVAIDAACGGCETTTSFTFQLPRGLTAGDDDRLENRSRAEGQVEINPTDEPSRIIDVAHWLTLFRMGAEEAGHESDKTQARELWIEVGQYLAEALKFYDDPNSDLPPEEAFFSDMSRERLRENPQQFSRQRLINLRAKLPAPSPASSRRSPDRGPGKPPRAGGGL